MKRFLSLALALAMMLTVFSCVAFAEDAAEPVELNLITTQTDAGDAVYASPVYQELVKQSGVKLVYNYVTADQFNVIIAGGDTTDLICTTYANNYATMASAGLLVELSDMISESEYLSAEDRDVEWSLLQATYDDGNGGIYGVINSLGMQGGTIMGSQMGTYVIWEYYKEIGAPEIDDYYDFIDALAEICELHPTTADGLPLYAYSLYNLSGQLYPYIGCAYGFGDRTYNAYLSTDMEDNTLIYEFLDEDGAYWKGMEYMNYAWSLGIVDPDSFTQTNTDFNTKFSNGQVLCHYYASNKMGSVIIPLEGTYLSENMYDIGSNVICIAKTCKNVEAAFALLDYLASPAAGRLIYSGVEGINWEYNEEGVPVATEETVALKKAGGDAWTATGVNNSALYSLIGVARGVDCGDNGICDLYRMTDYFANGMSATQADYTAFYSERDGVSYEYPNKVLYAHGVKDLSNLNTALSKGYGSAPDDIARIDATLLELAINAVPTLIMCDPAEFDTVKAEVMQSFIDAGAETSYEYWNSRWEELCEQYGE